MAKTARIRLLSWMAAALAVSTAGCSSVGDYATARLLDLWDVVPISVRYGPGAKCTVTATEFLGVGIGGGRAQAVGLALGRWGPAWQEYSLHVVLTGMEGWTLPCEGERVERWPGGPRVSSRLFGDRNLTRHRQRWFGRTLFLIPAGLGPDGWIPAHGGEPYVQDPWHSWADVEIDVFAGAGLRLGVCPDELVDFLAGLFGWDPLGDDAGGSTDRYWDPAINDNGRAIAPYQPGSTPAS